jgi:hypothetical protein
MDARILGLLAAWSGQLPPVRGPCAQQPDPAVIAPASPFTPSTSFPHIGPLTLRIMNFPTDNLNAKLNTRETMAPYHS